MNKVVSLIVVLSNMLTVAFATRTDSTSDPLIKRILAMAMEFNDLTGEPQPCLAARRATKR